MNNRQIEIDLLRILAAFSVFIYHYTDSFNYFSNIVPGNLAIGAYMRYGYMGVMLFFVISGYVLTMSTMQKTIAEFLRSRVIRLYPVFWLSCLIAALLPRLLPHLHPFIPYPSVKAILLNLTMVPSVLGATMINPVFWSLLEEVHFYLIIALIIRFRWWPKILNVLFIWLLIYAIQLFSGLGRSDDQIGILIPKHSLYFIAGMLFYLLRTKQFARSQILLLLGATFLLTLQVSSNFSHFTNLLYKDAHAVNFYGYFFINVFIFVIFWCIAERKIVLKYNTIIVKLGDLTYPFYLIHLYSLGLYWLLRDRVQSQLLLALMLILTVFVAYLINNYFEKPITRYLVKNGIKSRKPISLYQPVEAEAIIEEKNTVPFINNP